MFVKRLSILSLLVILQACSQAPQQPLRIGTNLWPGYEPLYLARELGYLDEKAIRLVEYPNSTEVIRSLRNGTIEIAALTLDEVLTLRDEGVKTKIILVLDISQGADVIMAKQAITELNMLKGKRVGVEATALGAYMLARALGKAQLSVKDVEVVSMPVNRHAAAYNQGELDAVVTFEPVRSILLEQGAHILFDSSQIPGEIIDVLAVRDDVMINHGDELPELLEQWFRALEYIHAQPHSAYAMMSKRSGQSAEAFEISLEGLEIPTWNKNQTMMTGMPAPLSRVAQQLNRVMREQALLKGDFSNAQLLAPELLLATSP